jgi:hypothetical protein
MEVFTPAIASGFASEDVKRIRARLGDEIRRRRPTEGFGPALPQVPWLLHLVHEQVERFVSRAARDCQANAVRRWGVPELQRALAPVLYEAVGIGYGLAMGRSRRRQPVGQLTSEVVHDLTQAEVDAVSRALRAAGGAEVQAEARPDWLPQVLDAAFAQLAPLLRSLALPALWRVPDAALLLAMRRLRDGIGRALLADLALGYAMAADRLQGGEPGRGVNASP